MTSPERNRLLTLLRQHAVLQGDFVLSSGQRASYYLDARLVTLSAEGSMLVGRILLEALPDGSEAVAGMTLGADPIVSAIALTSAIQGSRVDGLIVRKQSKEHGAGRAIEGPWRSGLRVCIVDDTLTTGTSALQAAAAIVEAGGVVTGVVALIDRGQGAGAAMETAGYSFRAIYTAAEILDSSCN